VGHVGRDMTKSVLIAEKEANLRLSLRYLMERQGYRVQEAEDGADTAQRVHDQVPDLVLIGVDMENRSGFDLCQSFRSDPSCRDMKIIFITSKARTVERDKGMALGADAYVTKPFANADLMATVRTVLED